MLLKFFRLKRRYLDGRFQRFQQGIKVSNKSPIIAYCVHRAVRVWLDHMAFSLTLLCRIEAS